MILAKITLAIFTLILAAIAVMATILSLSKVTRLLKADSDGNPFTESGYILTVEHYFNFPYLRNKREVVQYHTQFGYVVNYYESGRLIKRCPSELEGTIGDLFRTWRHRRIYDHA